jgi:predicted transcriptional regulator
VVRGKKVPEDTVQMADRVGVALFNTDLDTFQVAVKLFEAGVKPTA